MKNLLLASVAALIMSGVAQAQSVPNGTVQSGQVWNAAQWNAAWQSKQDLLPFTPLSPFNNLSELVNPATARANLGLGPFGAGTDAANLTGTVGSGRLSGSYPGITGVGTLSVGDTSATTVTATGGSTARSLAARFADVIYARDRGVTCDGSTDDTTALNAVLALLHNQHTAVILPAGTCVFTNTLSLNPNSSALIGQGPGATQLLYTGVSTTVDLIDVFGASSADAPIESVIQGLRVWSSTTMTAGSTMHVKWALAVQLRDLDFSQLNAVTNTLWNGLWVDQPNYVRLNDFHFETQNDALAVSGQGAATPPQYDFFAWGGKIGSATRGVHVGGGVDNIYFDRIMDTTNTNNVVIDNALAAFKNQTIYFGPQFDSDFGNQYGFLINDTLTDLTNGCMISIKGPVMHTVNHDGILIQNAPNCLINISSPLVSANAQQGIHVQDVSAKLAISSSTHISQNGAFGIAADFAYSNLLSPGAVHDNTSGNFNSNITTLNAPLLPYASLSTNALTLNGTALTLGTSGSSVCALNANCTWTGTETFGTISATNQTFTGHMKGAVAATTLSTCGTSPAQNAFNNDQYGAVLTGGGATACTLNFAVAYTQPPICIVSSINNTTPILYDTSTSAITITTIGAGVKFNYLCRGV